MEKNINNITTSGPPYVCKCGYVTKKISVYKAHLARQTPCKEQPASEFICECYDEFNNLIAFKKHKRNCMIVKKKDIYTKKNIAIANGNNNIITSGDNNNINITTNNILQTIMPEYLSVWPYTQKNKFICLDSTEHNLLMEIDDAHDPYITYFKLTHCNPNRCSLHNLYYPNKSKNTVYVYNGTEWETNKINLIILNLMKFESLDLKCFIQSNFCTNERTQRKIKKRINQINPTNKNSDLNDDDCRNERTLLQSKLKDMLFLCAPLIKKTYDLTMAFKNKKFEQLPIHTLSKSSESDSASVIDYKNNYEITLDDHTYYDTYSDI